MRSLLVAVPMAGLLCVSGIALAESAPAASDTIVVKTDDPDARVGSYNQPVWTTRRLFPTTRAYLIPEGTVETEFWMKHHTYKEGDDTDTLYQEEIEIGLPHRLQFDFYVNQKKEPGKKADHEGMQFEMRYAFADWGQLPLNPTLYLEYHPRKDKPEKGEARLLLSDDIGRGYHYSVNFGYEVELWGEEKERELVATAAFGTTVISPTFSIGAEVKKEWVDIADDRGHFHNETVVGPSFQWRPCADAHIDFAPLFGMEDDAPKTETYVIVGIDLRG